jgi:hypothetical protein
MHDRAGMKAADFKIVQTWIWKTLIYYDRKN